MLDLRSAIAVAEKQYPTKRMRGNPAETDGMFLFSFVEKDAKENESRWDATVIGVDKHTGACSLHNMWSTDIMQNAKPILEY